MKSKKLWPALIAVCALSLICGDASAAKGKVGIAFPTQDHPRWGLDGKLLMEHLQHAGYDVELFYGGDNDVPIQQRQLPRLVNKENVQALVIGPIDGKAITEALKPAQSKGIPIISYDRLIMNTPISYYVSFDNAEAGRIQGRAIAKALQLDSRAYSDPANIEFIAGPATDNNASVVYNGMMEIIKPYLERGLLVCPSGQTEFKDVSVEAWNADVSRKRMDALVDAQQYAPSGKRLDAVFAGSDGLADGVVLSLSHKGYSAGNYPFITGQDASANAVKGILAGERGMTIYKDREKMFAAVTAALDAHFSGKEAPVNDTTSYNNGTGPVKAILCEPELIDKSNADAKLIKTGKVKID